MSCGGGVNDALCKYKKLPKGSCKYLNIQQLPADEMTRSSFTAEKGNMFVSCDYSSEEARLGADIYNDKAMLDEFLYGTGDTHSLYAWMLYQEECKACGCKSSADIKKLAPQWRKKAKSPEFLVQFGGSAPTLAKNTGITIEEAETLIKKIEDSFTGMTEFAKKGTEFVKTHGYIIINPITGHRLNWWDYDKWKERQKSFTSEFWEDYRINHKGTGDKVALEVKEHFQAMSKYSRLARNVVTQGEQNRPV